MHEMQRTKETILKITLPTCAFKVERSQTLDDLRLALQYAGVEINEQLAKLENGPESLTLNSAAPGDEN